MKKFKGGLYADLSDYNTTLPNTEVLLNFFKSNPIGYRSGGMVRGIAGGNPTGMRVTGGFLANAQKFKAGSPADTVSAYYKRPTAQDLAYLPSGAESKAAQEGASWRPGNVGQAKQQYKSNLSNVVFNEMMSNPEKYGLGGVALQQMKESGTVPLQYMHEDVVKVLSETLQIPMIDVAYGMNPKYAESKFDEFGGKRYTDPVETYGEHGEVIDYVPSPLDLQEKKYKSTTIPSKKPDVVEEQGGYPGDRLAQRKFHTGPLPPSKEEIEAEKEKEKQKKYKNLNEYVKSETESDDSVTKSLDSMQTESVEDSIYPDAPTMEKPLGAEATFNKLLEQGGIADLIQGNKTANAADIKTINEIGKSYYGKKGDKDAPAWALPLMITGLTWAASDNPNILGAAAEGGIAGVGAYVAGEKEKKEDAKDQIELQLKKVDAIQKIKGRDLDVATLTSNMFSVATQTASADMRHFREIELAKYTEKNDQINATKDRLFKEHQLEVEVDLKLSTLALDRDKFESDDAYKKALVGMEIVKSGIQEKQHELELDLKYRDMGKLTDVMISHEGIPKKAKIRSYYDYQENKFKTEFQGWSTLSSSEFTSFNDEIYSMAKEQLQELIGQPEYTEKFEDLVTKLWEEKMISLYGTAEDAEKALNVDLGNN